MKTALRIPIYLVIETEVNVDRAKLVKILQESVIPDVTEKLVTLGDKLSYSKGAAISLQDIGKFHISIVSATTAMETR